MTTLAARLRPVAGDAARIEARWLKEAASGDAALLESLVLRRLGGEPVDRIVGSRGFWTLDLLVSPGVLSPRSDTETVVRAARDQALARHSRNAPLRILDLGTGSGAILLALLAEFPNAVGIGIDSSAKALAAARANAGRSGLADRAAFRPGDWRMAGWTASLGDPFDLVVSNPPYIPTAVIPTLEPEVRDHDPDLALDGGPDGLDCYRAILPGLTRILEAGAIAVLEFGDGQGEAVQAIALAYGFATVEFHNDLNGLQRAIVLSRIA